MAREADELFITEHLHMFDRVQIPGGLWVGADLLHRSGELCYRSYADARIHPLPVGSYLQAAGLGIVKYISDPRKKLDLNT